MRTIKPVVRRLISRSELLERLRPKKRSSGKVRLQHLVIRDFDFSELCLQRAELYNVVFERCRFRNTVFSAVLLGEIQALDSDFSRAAIEDCDIVWSSLRGARFDGASLKRAYFFNTDLSLASMKRADCEGASFLQCDLSGADFTEARLHAAQFLDCRLRGVRGLAERQLAYQPAMFSQTNW